MAITLLPATPEDSAAMIDAGMAAFANDKLSNAQFRINTATPEQLQEFRRWRIELSKERMTGPGKYWIKAIDQSNGSLVGYVGIYDPQAEVPDPSSISIPKPADVNNEVDDELRTKMKAVKERHIGQRDDVWYVQSMIVRPDYQGKTIATKLLQRGLEEADNAGQDVYLEGTAAARRLYRRCGFEDLEEIDLETVDYKLMAMIRHPRSNSTTQSRIDKA